MRRYQVIVRPLMSKVEPGFPGSLRQYLHDAMGIKVEQAHFMPQVRAGHWDGVQRFFHYISGTFYTGLLPWVTKLLAVTGVELDVAYEAPTIRPRLAELSSRVTLRDYQAALVDEALKRQRGIIHAAVNAGKTEIALELIRHLRCRTLYLVPSKELFRQACTQIAERLPDMPLGMIKEGMVAPELVTVAMMQSVLKRTRRRKGFGDEEEVDPYTRRYLASIEAVFADEVHHAGSTRWSSVLKLCRNAPYRFGLSATPLGISPVRDKLLEALTGPIFGKITTPELIERGLSTKTVVIMLRYQSMVRGLPEWSYHDLYEILIEQSVDRARGMFRAIKKELAAKRHVCVFVDTIDHGEFLQNLGLTLDLAPQVLYGAADATARARALDAFRIGARPLLITTLLREGVNIPEMDVLVIAGGKKAEVGIIQRAGRVLRTRKGKTLATIYDFIDHTSRTLLEHSWKRYQAYKAEGYPVELEQV